MYNPFEYYPIIDTVLKSRKIILENFRSDITVVKKHDYSPLTKADLEVNDLLIEAIKKYYPDAAIISEENSFTENSDAILKEKVFIIDPIDGTSSFIEGSPEFTVNIALKIKDKLVMGIIYSPIDDVLYYAEYDTLYKLKYASEDHCQISRLHHEKNSKPYLTVITTRRKDEIEKIKKDLSHLPQKLKFISFSSSLKFCYLADGLADMYYRSAKIKLWDIAAGFAIVNAVGFKILDRGNNNFLDKIFADDYIKVMQKDDFRVDPFVVR